MSKQDEDWFLKQLIQIQSRLYRYIATLAPSSSDAEDLYQQTSLTAWQQRDRFDQSRDFYPWVCGIARNHVGRYYRERSKQVLVLHPDVVDQLAVQMVEDEEYLESRQRALSHCLEKLPARQRDLIQQFYGQNGTAKAFAQQLGRPLEAIYKSLQRIRASLNDCVNQFVGKEGIQ